MEIVIDLSFHLTSQDTLSPLKINDDFKMANRILPKFISTSQSQISTNIKSSLQKDISRQIISNNNNPMTITINRTIDYNEVNSYIEGKVIDMNMEIQSEIDKIVKRYRNIHFSLFAASLLTIILSRIPGLLNDDIGIVLKPLSIAFSLMIMLNYYLRRIK